MKQSVGLPTKVIACALTALLGLSGAFVPDVAWAEEQPAVPEWAVDDGEAQDGLSAQATLPTAYDMRSDGLVTPVKFQNPWGSCWAFGGTAAAETSIISAYGSTYEQSRLDLSERHLTYFALQPVSEAVDPNQVGEGLYTFDTSANAAFDAGGLPVYITTLFSQGIGPMLESLYPYRGNGARRSIEDFNEDPVKETKEVLAPQFGGMEGLEAFIDSRVQQSGQKYDQVLAGLVAFVKDSYESSPTYSKKDDWTIPETNDDGTPNRLVSNGMVLRDGNVLPPYWVGEKTSPSQAGMEAIKQEVLNGRGVSIMYHADQSTLYARSPDAQNPYQTQYVFDEVGLDHGVCIVGWDDNFNKENFHHEAEVPQTDGPTIDRTDQTTPPGNGAWIVKNSWGSETDATTDDLDNVINKRKWGTLNDEGQSTGYFYLSYYDKSIAQAESMEFDADLGSGGAFAVMQHDYMPSNGGFYTTPATEDVTSSANVFEAKDGAIALKSVSTRTSETNARVTLAIYELNDGATDPTDGKLLYRTSRNFEYGGFHRLNIDLPITIGKGKKFSVVSTMSTVGSGGARVYGAVASQGVSEAYMRAARGDKAKVYSSAVVNEGESYLYTNGSWQDWKAYTDELPANDEIKKYLPNAEKYVEAAPIDNFSIKVYGVPTEEPKTFPDVPEDAWYHDVVYRAVSLGIFSGYGSGYFGPNDHITRGQMAAVLWNMAGHPVPGANAKQFPDVRAKMYYTNAIAWAYGAGVVSGYENGNFGPDDLITREQLAAMLSNYARNVAGKQTVGSSDDYKSMKDAAEVSDWAENSVGWCFRNNILSGTEQGYVNPHGNAARAEAAKMTVFLHDLLLS